MFNLNSIMQMASQALMSKLTSSDQLYTQWQNFCTKMGIPSTSRAEFDNLISQFNSTDQNAKMSQLTNGLNSNLMQKFLSGFMNGPKA